MHRSVLDHMGSAETPFEQVLNSELLQLKRVLLREHEFETKSLRTANTKMREELEKFEAYVEEEAAAGKEMQVARTVPVERWAHLTERLMEDSMHSQWQEIEEPTALHREELHMRSVWKVSFQDVLRRKHMNFRSSKVPSDSNMRMNQALQEDCCLQGFVVPPRSSKQLTWSMIGSFLILWDLITIPLGIFDLPEFIDFLSIVARISFVYWLFDMPLHFLFGLEIQGSVELRPTKLARHYLKTWFFIDLLVIVIDAGITAVEISGEVGVELTAFHSARFLRALRLLRLLRLLRVAKLQQEMMVLANRFLSTHTFMLMKVVAGVFMILLINHIIACSWFGIGTWEFDGKSWMFLLGLDPKTATFAESYSASMHWALTQFTPATNNIAPDNALERTFALVIILLAIGVFSSFITQITSTMSSLRSARTEQSQKRAKLLQFFSERGLSVGLFGKIQQALQREGHFEVRLKEPDVALIQKIPERLKMQLHEEMFLASLQNLNIWPPTTEDDQYFFTTVCHHAMEEHSAIPGQDVFLPGTDCHDVYIIESGFMGYVLPPGDFTMDAEKVQGSLCLPCLWAEWTHRGRLAANMGICYYARLRCDQFCIIIKKFGGPLFQHLQIFGILLVSEVEAMDDEGIEVTDMGLDEELMRGFVSRAERFASLQKFSAGRHTTQSLDQGAHGIYSVAAMKSIHQEDEGSVIELITEKM
ncbi:Potassium/sodium hyperpolarization-activated cyclic nucleotide-gated channel 2 (Brain cyclic nucleotide-gated channel 2) (BCNG-2) [Durusdinium trenchii]|uniref:Potassium/sodium hyperpolarization-activated cyclic nucleotide-gated channel 2 (Brain cyclic nucleotide-gated channel 2) (BCNG-2) n=2 Tax=Durusdinium trenchii TaxID=1381693 RepID=A0ABP0IXC2_9DINO